MSESRSDDGRAVARRTGVLARHLAQELSPVSFFQPSPCLAYQPPELHCGLNSALVSISMRFCVSLWSLVNIATKVLLLLLLGKNLEKGIK